MKNKPEMHSMSKQHYGRLLLMIAVSFGSMYALMYAMVDTFANVYASFNQFYMAGLMTAPMAVIELVLMGAMYHNKKLNAVIIAASLVALSGFWILIRQQTAVSDEQFLRSMIPHHAGALLMCKQASLHDAEIMDLCKTIISGQQSEIDLMKAKLGQLEK
ncbi:MAG: DUF305 domain-containing protein [Pseudomonadota bacterium]